MTRQILVSSPDGVIPLELLSQGMSSVLSWTGTLIARLSDVEASGSNPHERAVVLIDEIDAHLHPAWQRQIVEAVQSEFPGIQVVATTHSPFVVGSLEGDDEEADCDGERDEPQVRRRLWRLHREGNELHSERLSFDYRGWRADQILTARAFDTSARDPDRRVSGVRAVVSVTGVRRNGLGTPAPAAPDQAPGRYRIATGASASMVDAEAFEMDDERERRSRLLPRGEWQSAGTRPTAPSLPGWRSVVAQVERMVVSRAVLMVLMNMGAFLPRSPPGRASPVRQMRNGVVRFKLHD